MKIKTKFAIALFATTIGFAAELSAQDAPPAAPAAPSTPKQLPPASTKTGVTFEADIKPIFDSSACTKCHGAQKPAGGIVLTSLESTLKGGKDGKILVVGDSTKGSLVMAVAHIGDRQTFMPKGRGAKALTDEQVGLIRAWIDQGTK